MTTRDEGVIKFDCRWQKNSTLPAADLADLIQCRNNLCKLGLVGVYPDGIGYGNLSQRAKTKSQFIISGSQTGRLPQATPDHFTLVTKYSISENCLECSGPIQASSESLTHAMIYEIFSNVNAVIHVHSAILWNKLKHTIPTTREEIAYGTAQMAQEIKRLEEETYLSSYGILVMAGHEDGIITFAENLHSAYEILMRNASKIA